MDSHQAQLFGGAMICQLPSTFFDISSIRHVPDNQEVFAHKQGDDSIIFEILELAPEASTLEEGVLFHFDSLKEDNDASDATIDLSPIRLGSSDFPLSKKPGIEACFSRGRQTITKFNERNSSNMVEIWLAVVRLPSVRTDIVITLNRPLVVSPNSSSAKDFQPLQHDAATRVFMTILQSFAILDWTIFEA